MKIGMLALTAALVLFAVPAWAGPTLPCDTHAHDLDSDTICDNVDNCTAFSSATITCDTDNDGYGNPCDGDFDNAGSVNPADFSKYFVPDLIAAADSGIGSDMDCAGSVNPADFSKYLVPQLIQAVPGPSGLSCAGTTPCP